MTRWFRQTSKHSSKRRCEVAFCEKLALNRILFSAFCWYRWWPVF